MCTHSTGEYQVRGIILLWFTPCPKAYTVFKVFSPLLHLVILLRLNYDSSLVLLEGMGCSAPHLLASANASAEGLDKIYKKAHFGSCQLLF